MSGNIKFRWFVIAFLLFTLFCSSCAWMLESAGQRIKQRDLESKILKTPNDYDANYGLGVAYVKRGKRFSIPSTNWKKVFFSVSNSLFRGSNTDQTEIGRGASCSWGGSWKREGQ